MRKLLLSFFLIYGGFSASAQTPLAPDVNEHKGEETKTSIRVTLQKKSADTLAKFLEVKVDGSNLAQPIFRIQPVTSATYNSFEIQSLSPGTTYSITTRACETSPCVDSTSSAWTSPKYLTTQIDYPAKATVEEIANCPNLAGIRWTISEKGGPVSNINIKKSYSGSGGPWYDVANLPSYHSSYYDGDINPGIATTYAVFTQNALGESTPSNYIVINVKPYIAPGAPINLRVDDSGTTNNKVRIVWENASEDECKTNVRESYYIMTKRQFESEFSLKEVIYPFSTSYEITNLEQNEPIEILVYARSDQGIWGHQAKVVAKTHGVASKPSNIIGVSYINKIGQPAIGVSWNHPVIDADYYVVEYSTDKENFTHLSTLKSDEKLINHLNISEGVQYTYRVKAGNYVYGESEFGYMDGTVSVDYTAVPNAPYALRATLSGSNVNLIWVDDSNKEDKYIVERANSETGTFTQIAELDRNVTTYADNIGSSSENTFVYRVLAENPLGASNPSNLAKVTKAAAGGGNSAIVVFPNPTADKVSITLPEAHVKSAIEVKIFNQANQLILSKDFKGGVTPELSLKKFTTGLYNVVVKAGDYQETKKVFKQ